jgi:integrase/recombinase XerD
MMKFFNNYLQFYTFSKKVPFSTSNVPDLIQNQYVIHSVDHVWFSDFSYFGPFWAFVIMDAATRRILVYSIKKAHIKSNKCPFTSKDCIIAINEAFNQNDKPFIFHSDKGGQFHSKKFIKFLKDNNIKQSTVDTRFFHFGNQLIERLFKTLKSLLQKNDPQYHQIHDYAQFSTLFAQIVTDYNNNEHKALIGLTPNTMQDAFLLQQLKEQQEPEELKQDALVLYQKEENTPLFAKSFTKKGLDIEEIRATVVKNYAGDWIKFFIEYSTFLTLHIKNDIQKSKEDIQKQAEINTQRIIDEYIQQNKSLRANINQMQKVLDDLQKRALDAEAALKAKEQQKLRRLHRQRMPSRDMAGLKVALNVINQQKLPPFTKARDIVCLCLLFFTGLRVSNLLLLQARHIKSFIQDYSFDLPLIKKRNTHVQTFFLPVAAYPLFEQYKSYFSHLIEHKNDNDFVITPIDSNTTLSRVTLNSRLNLVLNQVSLFTHKNIKTHSFRINLTTALIEAVGIEAASKTMGHTDIRTTEMYNRRHLDANEMVKALNKAHNHVQKMYIQKEKRNETKRLKRAISKNKEVKEVKDVEGGEADLKQRYLIFYPFRCKRYIIQIKI